MILYLLGLAFKATCVITIGAILAAITFIFGKTLVLKRSCTCKVDFSGKTVLITGGNTGIGFETAKILAKRGARIIIASRNAAKSEQAVKEIIDATGNRNIEQKPLDLCSLTDIKRFADDFNRSYDRLDVLINNAGRVERIRTFTADGIDSTFMTNHVGPTYLTHLLLNKVIASKPSRILFLTSTAHACHKFDPTDLKGEAEMWYWLRYATTKYCNVLMARALSKILPDGVTCNALHPGISGTEMWEEAPPPLKKVLLFLSKHTMTQEECALSSVHVASAPSLAHVSGEYIDNHQVRPPFREVKDEVALQYYQDTLNLVKEKLKTS